MIQVYNTNNADYSKNGDMTLTPISAVVHPVLNGVWEGTIKHPIDREGRWKYLVEEAVIKMPSFNGEQLFRIKQKTKSDSGITATLEPIFMDAMDDCFLVDVRPTGKTGKQALDMMTAPNSKYSAESNITKKSTAYYQYKNLIEALNSDDENSFVNRWGGEILFDNYKVIINTRVGGDYGVELRYGKNIPADGLSEDVDTREVVTRIYPKAYNGYTMTGKGYVESPLKNSYPTVKAATITFEDVKMRADAQEDDSENGVSICDTQAQLDAALRKKCEEQFELGIDKPKVTITAKMLLLQNTEAYKDYKILEGVSLGDTIHCIHSRLGIRTNARVIELEYDSILKKVISVELGDFRYNYFNNVSSAVNRIETAIRSDGSVVAEQVKGIINAINASLQLQSTAAKKVDGRAFLIEDLDPASGMFGAMEAGTQGLRISKERNPDNREWLWTTAITALGIIADTIVTGRLTDKTGESYWDMDTGEMVLSGIFRQFNKKDGYKSVDIMNNRINIYSWQKDGDYIGSIGSLANKADPEGRQTLGVYADTTDRVGIGYISGKNEDGENVITYMATFDPTKLGKESYSDRAIKFKEIPEIPGTITLPVTIGTTTLHFFNGLCIGRDYGQTFYGEFKTGADETVKVSNGVIKDIV